MFHVQIDASVILLMTDEQLKTYLPSYGDRLAVVGFCRRKDNNPKSRRTKLFDRLKSKLQKVQNDDHAKSTTSQEAPKTKNAQKTIRKIELGWLLFDDSKECFTQVRARRGGGTRKIDAGKEWTKTDLTERAMELFFPDGESTVGNMSNFDLDLMDYKERSLDLESTVGQLYDETKLPMLRFYLTAKNKTSKTKPNTMVQPDRQEQTQCLTFTSTTYPPGAASESFDTSDVIFLEDNTEMNMDVVSLYSTEHICVQGEISSGTDGTDDSGVVTFLGETVPLMNEQSLDDTLPLLRI